MMNEAMEKGTVRALAHAYVYPSFHGLLHVKLEELGNFPITCACWASATCRLRR